MSDIKLFSIKQDMAQELMSETASLEKAKPLIERSYQAN